MIQDELVYQILQEFRFTPTNDQANALRVFAEFMTDRDERAAMILRGCAGTGKTSLAGPWLGRSAVELQGCAPCPDGSCGQGVLLEFRFPSLNHPSPHLPRGASMALTDGSISIRTCIAICFSWSMRLRWSVCRQAIRHLAADVCSTT